MFNIRLPQDTAGGYFSVLNLNQSCTAAITAACTGIQDPDVVHLPAIRLMRMPIQRCRSTGFSGIPQKKPCGLFYAVEMSMGHIKQNATNTAAQDLSGTGRTTIAVTVPCDNIERNMNVFLLHRYAIIVKVSQVYHSIGSDLLNATSHKTEGRMGIR